MALLASTTKKDVKSFDHPVPKRAYTYAYTRVRKLAHNMLTSGTPFTPT